MPGKRRVYGTPFKAKVALAAAERDPTTAQLATNLAIDPALLVRAVRVSGERTKKAAVTEALQEFIARREQRRVAELLGKLVCDSSFDYMADRTRGASCSSLTPACGRWLCVETSWAHNRTSGIWSRPCSVRSLSSPLSSCRRSIAWFAPCVFHNPATVA
ncbi:MAG: type II toxin-antitoxin system VapB family antitoxin [Pirellulales bacterium]